MARTVELGKPVYKLVWGTFPKDATGSVVNLDGDVIVSGVGFRHVGRAVEFILPPSFLIEDNLPASIVYKVNNTVVFTEELALTAPVPPVTPAGSWLSGNGAPGSGDGLDDLDGVSDPWRWADSIGGWLSPAYRVTWADGDTFESGPGAIAPDPANQVYVVEGADPSLSEASVNNATSDSNTGGSVTSPPMSGSGSGVIYRVQNEPGFGHTVVPDAADDVLDYTGDLVVGDPYEWPDVTTGADGQFYINVDNHDLYGPRTNGVWTKLSTLPAPA